MIDITPSSAQVRPVSPICMDGIVPGEPATPPPVIEWMNPSDLSVDEGYQRDLNTASIALIRRIVAEWDWRKFQPPVVAWTETDFRIVDGQHTAIAAASHPGIDKIPVMVIEAAAQRDQAAAFIGQNTGRLRVSAVQMHIAAAAAGDMEAQTVDQVCARAGVKVIRGAYGAYQWKAAETIAVKAIAGLIDRRGAMRAREVLDILVKAECAPISAHEIRAAELLMTDPEFTDHIEPDAIVDVIQATEDMAKGEARLFAKTHCVPLWRGMAAVWFKKARKRRKVAA